MNFESLRIPQLQTIHRGIDHKVEVLQEKMAGDMGRIGYHDILPRNFSILPIEKCSLHDRDLLIELTNKRFDCYWALQKKIAEENDALEEYYAKFKFYSYRNTLSDDEINELFDKADNFCNQRMTTHKIIQCIMQAPNFLEEVMV